MTAVKQGELVRILREIQPYRRSSGQMAPHCDHAQWKEQRRRLVALEKEMKEGVVSSRKGRFRTTHDAAVELWRSTFASINQEGSLYIKVFYAKKLEWPER
jgi:hypothetical protein